MFENQLGLQEQLDVMKQYGIVFDTGAPIRGILANDSIDQLANDAAMVTAANSGIPVEFTSYIDPMVIPILTATRGAREIFGEAKKGDWTTSYARFQTSEITGEVEAYTDYGQGGASDVNPTFPVRTQYIYQTNIRYGDREVDVASRARLQLAADKQRAAATVIDIASNKFALYGVAGLEIYGLLNDPNLPAAVSPLPIVMYNVPGRTVADILPETVGRLAEIDTIVGIKDASGNLARIADHRLGCGLDFCQLSGNDDMALAFNAGGGVGHRAGGHGRSPSLAVHVSIQGGSNCVSQALISAIARSSVLLPQPEPPVMSRRFPGWRSTLQFSSSTRPFDLTAAWARPR